MDSFQFTREQRILTAAEYQTIFKTAKKFSTLGMALYVKKTATPQARLGMVVAKKQFKRAVDRNLLKRQVRESFRHQQLPPVDIVVVMYKQLGELSNSKFQQQLSVMWQRLHGYFGRA